MTTTVLLIDENFSFLMGLKQLLQTHGYSVYAYRDLNTARLDRKNHNNTVGRCDILIVGHTITTCHDGLRFAEHMARRRAFERIIVLGEVTPRDTLVRTVSKSEYFKEPQMLLKAMRSVTNS